MNALHPTLKSLWNIPHVLRFPDTMPAVPDVIQFIEKHITDWSAEKQTLDPTIPEQAELIAVHNCNIAILKHKLEELHRAFPEFGLRDKVPLSLSAPNASTNQNHNPSPNAAHNSPSPSVGEGRGEGAPITPTMHISPIIPIPPITPNLTNQHNPAPTETTETAPQPQPHPAETEVRPTETKVRLAETEPRPTETETICPPSDPSATTAASGPASSSQTLSDISFYAALAKIPEKQRKLAADLYEHVHHRARFASLTSQQRAAIYELCKDHTVDDVLQLLPQAPPIGLNFHTSRAGLFRFCNDFKRILLDERKLALHEQNEEQRLATEQAFQNANASDESFRQATVRGIRKRLFTSVENPRGDHHEIRWLLKSLEMLRKPSSGT
jgi:hypothetical protein